LTDALGGLGGNNDALDAAGFQNLTQTGGGHLLSVQSKLFGSVTVAQSMFVDIFKGSVVISRIKQIVTLVIIANNGNYSFRTVVAVATHPSH
jgi:hypothetical protein